MQQIVITISVPDGTTVKVEQDSGVTMIDERGDPSSSAPGDFELYWNKYLSSNAKKVYKAAAKRQLSTGPKFTFEDLANDLNMEYKTVKAYHRLSGRTRKRWERDRGTEPPLRLAGERYLQGEAGGDRWQYSLDEDAARQILVLVGDSDA